MVVDLFVFGQYELAHPLGDAITEQLSASENSHGTQGPGTYLWHVASLKAHRVMASPYKGPILKAVCVDDDDNLRSRVGV